MKYLSYGILRNARPLRQLPAGAEGQPISLVRDRGLVLAFATVPDAYQTPTMDMLLAFARVVQTLHRQATILPMRYGCLFEHRDQLGGLLRARQGEFETALAEVQGCDEMGIRVLLGQLGQERPPALSFSPASASCESGAAYLVKRQGMYAAKDQQDQRAGAWVDRIKKALAGLFVKCRAECAWPGNGLMSVHFLVPRTYREPFRRACQRFETQSQTKVLLSGPWPPYNFAVSQ